LQNITAIVEVREKYPTWSKYKIGAYLRQRGVKLSDSSVGRILKAKNKINSHLSQKKKRIYKRSRKRMRIDGEIFILKHPGDLVQIDVKHLYRPWGDKAYQFTAIDCVTKLRILRLYTVKTAATGRTFLREAVRFLPFRIKRVQSDNGSEFLGNFRKECSLQKIRHYFSYPNSPEQNAFVESSHSTDEREFYSRVELPADTEKLRALLQNWQDRYNHERPHQSLNQRTPWDYYKTICSKN
jgi:transposase InsO family protein